MRVWRKNGHAIYQAPRTEDPRSTPWAGDGVKSTLLERWTINHPDTTANTALYFIMFAHGPFDISGTLYLIFDGAISVRCKDGDPLSFDYPGIPAFWRSTDTHIALQDADPIPSTRPTTFKHVDIVNPGTANHALTISISGLTATITLATDPSAAISSTNSQVKTKWDTTPSAAAWGTMFIISGSALAAADSGDLHGDYSHSFSTTAADLSWTKEYDSYIPGTPFFGTGSFLRISKQTGAYATAGDRFQVAGPPGDNTVGDWSTGLSTAQILEPTIVDWAPIGTPPIWVRCTSFSAPPTAQAGADIAVTFQVVDAIAGTPQAEPSFGGTLLPILDPDPLEIISTGSGTSITDHIKIKYVGPWLYAPAVGDNMSKLVFSNVINITPGPPEKAWVDTKYVSTPITGWRVTSTDDDDYIFQPVGHGNVVEVFLRDQYGNLCYDAFDKNCALSIHETGAPVSPVILTGTLVKPFINGIAKFDDLIVNGLSITSKLRATYVEGSVANDFDFFPSIFGFFEVSNSSPVIGKVITVKYKICDYWGNVLDSLSSYDPVTLSDGDMPGGFSGNGSVLPVAGIATFTGVFSVVGIFNLFAQGSQSKYKDSGFFSPWITVTDV